MGSGLRYEVIVGNLGRVYAGKSRLDANLMFREYRKKSDRGYGRVAGEAVTMFRDGEPVREHRGAARIVSGFLEGEHESYQG